MTASLPSVEATHANPNFLKQVLRDGISPACVVSFASYQTQPHQGG